MTQATDTDIREIRDLLLGMDKKLDVHMAKTEEQLKGIDARFAGIDSQLADIKVQLRSQDNRLWTFVGALFVAGCGAIAKFAFFPGGQP
jgi:hypothetical protein